MAQATQNQAGRAIGVGDPEAHSSQDTKPEAVKIGLKEALLEARDRLGSNPSPFQRNWKGHLGARSGADRPVTREEAQWVLMRKKVHPREAVGEPLEALPVAWVETETTPGVGLAAGLESQEVLKRKPED